MGFGSKAYGFCGRCGFRYKLSDLKPEVVNYRETDARVCPTCWDPDQPQLHVNELEVDDPRALRDPRPVGASGGRLMTGTLSYDFTLSVDDFTATGGTLTHDSAEGYAVLSMAVSGSTAKLQNTSVAIDTSLYRYVRMRFSFASLIADPDQYYSFSWRRLGEGSYESAMVAADVDLYVGGSRFHEISWDTRDGLSVGGIAPVWTGTLDQVSFSFLNNDPDSTSSVEVDWIRFEPGYIDQGV